MSALTVSSPAHQQAGFFLPSEKGKKQENKTGYVADPIFKATALTAAAAPFSSHSIYPSQKSFDNDYKKTAHENDLNNLKSILELLKKSDEPCASSAFKNLSKYFDLLSVYEGGIVCRYTKPKNQVSIWNLLSFSHFCMEKYLSTHPHLALSATQFLDELKNKAWIFEYIAAYEAYQQELKRIAFCHGKFLLEKTTLNARKKEPIDTLETDLARLDQEIKKLGTQLRRAKRCFKKKLSEKNKNTSKTPKAVFIQFLPSQLKDLEGAFKKMDGEFRNYIHCQLETINKCRGKEVFEAFYKYEVLEKVLDFTKAILACKVQTDREAIEQWVIVLREGLGEEFLCKMSQLKKLRNYFEHPEQFAISLQSTGKKVELYPRIFEVAVCLKPVMEEQIKKWSDELKKADESVPISHHPSDALCKKIENLLDGVTIKDQVTLGKKPLYEIGGHKVIEIPLSEANSSEEKKYIKKLNKYASDLDKFREEVLERCKKGFKKGFPSKPTPKTITNKENNLEKKYKKIKNLAPKSKDPADKKLGAYMNTLNNYRAQLKRYFEEFKNFNTHYIVNFRRGIELDELKKKLSDLFEEIEQLISKKNREQLHKELRENKIFNLTIRRKLAKTHLYMRFLVDKLESVKEASTQIPEFNFFALSIRDNRNFLIHDLWRGDLKSMVDITFALSAQRLEYLGLVMGCKTVDEGFFESKIQSQSVLDSLQSDVIGRDLVNARDDMGGTLLHYLSMKPSIKNLKIIKGLVSMGANIHIPDIFGRRPLHIATQYGFEELVTFLIQCGAVVSQWSLMGTPIEMAKSSTDCKIARIISPHLGIGRNKANDLLDAVECLDEERVKSILDNEKVDPNIEFSGQLPLVSLFRKEGVDESLRIKIAELLLNKGADIHKLESVSQQTVMHAACSSTDNEKVIEFLINKHPELNRQDPSGKTPLHCAVKSNFENWVKQLLSKEIDVDVKDNEGFTPFLVACKYFKSSPSIIKQLVDKKCNTSLRPRSGGARGYALRNQKLRLLLEELNAISPQRFKKSAPRVYSDIQPVVLF